MGERAQGGEGMRVRGPSASNGESGEGGELWSGEGWRADGERGPIARQPPSDQSLSSDHLHKVITNHGKGGTEGEGRDRGRSARQARPRRDPRRDGQRDSKRRPHPTGLPPNLLLGATVNDEKYPISKYIYKM